MRQFNSRSHLLIMFFLLSFDSRSFEVTSSFTLFPLGNVNEIRFFSISPSFEGALTKMEISSTQFGVVAAKSYLKPNKKDYLKRVEKDFPNLPLAEKQKIADEIYNFDKIEAEIKNKKLIRNTTDDVIIMLDQELMKLYQKRYEFMNGQYDVYLKSIKPVAYSEAMNQLNITGDFQGAKEKLINSPDEVNKIGEKPSTEFIGDLNERIENANRYFISLYSKSIDNKN